MAGKHLAAAIQNSGAIIGDAMTKFTLAKADLEEERRKEEVRRAELQAERSWKTEEGAKDRSWEQEKYQAGLDADADQLEFRKQKALADLEVQYASISSRESEGAMNRESREKAAAIRASGEGKNAGYTPEEQLDDSRADIASLRRSLDSIRSTPSPGGKEAAAELERRLRAKEADYEKLKIEAKGGKVPEAPDYQYDKGIIGSGMGALKPSDKPAATGDNTGARTQEEFDAAYQAAKPGARIKYWDDESNAWRYFTKTDE